MGGFTNFSTGRGGGSLSGGGGTSTGASLGNKSTFPAGGTNYSPGSAGLGGGGADKSDGSPCEFWEKGKKIPGYWEKGKCIAQEKEAPLNFMPNIPGAGGGAPAVGNRPAAPAVAPPRELGGNIPELERMGTGYETHLRNLESGAGYSADVLAGQQRDQMEAQVSNARAAAERDGRPFNEEQMRAELQRGAYSAQAQEKLGREAALTSAYGQAPSIVGANEAARQGRWKTGQAGDLGYGALQNQQYGTAANMYGDELGAATSANNALMNFLGNLYGSMMGSGGMTMNQRYG
jgi:hypothetical protein